jgi:hypothetical protein
MSESITPPPTPSIQFDRAVSTSGATEAGVVCAQCERSIANVYFTLAQRPFCGSCKLKVEREYAATLTSGSFAKATVFGLGAAAAGAAVYYGVIAITNFEIGIVAILIGYMVGYAINRATRGGGARRYQVLGAALTYLAVGMAYLPLAIKGAREGAGEQTTVSSDSTRIAARDSDVVQAGSPAAAVDTAAVADTGAVEADSSAAATAEAPEDSTSVRLAPTSFFKAMGVLVALVLALPVMVVFGSLPSGLISALIIGIGIRQAWRMTTAPDLSFAGPLRVAPPPAEGTPPDSTSPALS